MKKLILTIVAIAGSYLFMTASSQAGVHIGVYVERPGYYYYPDPYPYRPYYGEVIYYHRYGHYYHHRHYRYWRR